MLAIPLAWLQLTYQKGRLAIAIAGIMFAVILIAMQLGFRDALFNNTSDSFEKREKKLFIV
jgi:putative ABC transport system permease protein